MENLNRLSDKEQLFRILTFIAPLSEGLTRRFDQCISSKRYPKRHLLLSEGAISKHIYFICEGSARAFYHDRQGREHTTWFQNHHPAPQSRKPEVPAQLLPVHPDTARPRHYNIRHQIPHTNTPISQILLRPHPKKKAKQTQEAQNLLHK